MREGVVEVESPAFRDGTANYKLPSMKRGIAGIDPRTETRILKRKERIATKDGNARAIGAADPVHFIQGIEITRRVRPVSRDEVVGGRAAREVVGGFAARSDEPCRLPENVFDVRYGRHNRRIRRHLLH